jgi:hypothetical protein
MGGLEPFDLTVSGEQLFRPPEVVKASCRDALGAADGRRFDGDDFAKYFARRLAEGQPIAVSAMRKMHEFFRHVGGVSSVQKEGVHPATLTADRLTLNLMGGEVAYDWVVRTLKAAGEIPPDRTGAPVEWQGQVIKVSDELGVVFGWAIICKIDGVPYFDVQGDHIPEASMLEAAVDFMVSSRVLGDMHQKAEGGNVVFAFPMTAEIAAAYGISTKQSGLMIGVKPANPETLEKFRDGTYTGFSIGGRRLEDEDV